MAFFLIIKSNLIFEFKNELEVDRPSRTAQHQFAPSLFCSVTDRQPAVYSPSVQPALSIAAHRPRK